MLAVGCTKADSLEEINNEISTGAYTHYLLVRGKNLKSPVLKLKEFVSLAASNPKIIYEFETDNIGNWFVFKFPGNESHWMFHNITFWFLGYGTDDFNYANEVISIAISSQSSGVSYLVSDRKSRNKNFAS